MFKAALWMIAKSGNNPNVYHLMNKMRYIHTMEYYLAIKSKDTDTCHNMDEP